MSNTSDLDATEASIRELIASHDLRLLGASFSSPDVFLDEDVSLVDLLDVVAAAAPSFVSLRVARFEAGEFEQQMDEVLGKQREAVSEEGRALIRQHRRRNGQVQDLALQWAADGVIYAFFAVADWHAALTEAVEESASEADDYDEEQAAQRARTRELVAQLEALPEFRAVAPTKRRAKGDQLLDSLLTQEGDFSLPFLGHIVRAAVSQAAVNAEEALAGLDLAEFASDPRWRGMRTQASRTDFIERALLERTGYGVVRSTADAFRPRRQSRWTLIGDPSTCDRVESRRASLVRAGFRRGTGQTSEATPLLVRGSSGDNFRRTQPAPVRRQLAARLPVPLPK